MDAIFVINEDPRHESCAITGNVENDLDRFRRNDLYDQWSAGVRERGRHTACSIQTLELDEQIHTTSYRALIVP